MNQLSRKKNPGDAVPFRAQDEDPYAKALTGKFRNTENLLLAYDPNSPLKDLSLDGRDNVSIVPKSIVVDDRFEWEGDTPPDIPLHELII